MQNEKRPEISIIVPVYRVERYLNACINSILAQTFADFELILVDDGSPDSCPALCDMAAEKDPRVRVIHKQNGGVSTARNAGLDVACGNWVAFVDSDDVLRPQYLEKLYMAAVTADAQATICEARNINETGALLKETDNQLFDEVLEKTEVINRVPLSIYQVPWSKLFRAELFRGMRFPENKAFEDTWFLPGIYSCIEKMACVQEALYDYRIVKGSAMHRRITLKTLDRVEACYRMFLVMYEQNADTLCQAYRMVLTGLVDIWLHLPAAERKSPRMKECIGFERDAWRKLKQAHGITPRAVWEMLAHSVSPEAYIAARRKRLARMQAQNAKIGLGI